MIYKVFIKYRIFFFKCWNFSELCQFCCSAVILPAIWRSRVRNIFKNTIFNEQPVGATMLVWRRRSRRATWFWRPTAPNKTSTLPAQIHNLKVVEGFLTPPPVIKF